MRKVLSFLVCIAFAKVHSDVIDQSKECLIHYLRTQNLDDSVFDSTPRESELSDSCVRRIASEKDSVFIEAHRKFERTVPDQDTFDCFMNSIRNNDEYKNLLLKKKAIESVKLSWKAKLNPKNWVPGPKSKAKSTTASEIEEIEQGNLFVCEFEKKFQDDFDLIAEARENTSRDDEQCIRSFLERRDEQEQAPIVDINCSATLDRKKLEIIRKLRALYASYGRSLRKCMDEALATEDFFSPEFRALIRNRTTKSTLQTQEKKVYVADMLTLFKTVKSKCRG